MKRAERVAKRYVREHEGLIKLHLLCIVFGIPTSMANPNAKALKPSAEKSK